MTTTPEALRLADAIDADGLMCESSLLLDAVPTELRRAAAEIERLTAELSEWRKLKDPVVLHANLLRGMPAKLAPAQIWHLVADDRERLAELEQEILGLTAERDDLADSCEAKADRIDRLGEMVERLKSAQQWRPIETAPKDGTPVLGLCVHAADPYWLEDRKRLTIYGGHVEAMNPVKDGPHVVVWGGAFDDSTWEAPGASMPDWWFRYGSDFEEVANPTHWMPLPDPPVDTQRGEMP